MKPCRLPISSNDFVCKLAKAIGIVEPVARIVIDASCNDDSGVVTVFYETYASAEASQAIVDLVAGLKVTTGGDDPDAT